MLTFQLFLKSLRKSTRKMMRNQMNEGPKIIKPQFYFSPFHNILIMSQFPTMNMKKIYNNVTSFISKLKFPL